MAMATAIEPLTPALKWAGGKRWQLPHLVGYWEKHRGSRLVEPFCGGLAVTLGLMPERALANDVNPHLVNFYQQIQRSAKPFPEFVQFEHEEKSYYLTRTWFNELIQEPEGRDSDTAAALFYYLNKTGFNGLCRFNASGGFNVPFGKYKSINYRTDFTEYYNAFAGWSFTCGDFEALPIEPSDFVYADPPYDVEFTTYSAGGFNWADQVRAATWLSRHTGPVILANQATERIVRLYTSLGFDLQFLSAPRRISCTGDRAAASEVLATRNLL